MRSAFSLAEVVHEILEHLQDCRGKVSFQRDGISYLYEIAGLARAGAGIVEHRYTRQGFLEQSCVCAVHVVNDVEGFRYSPVPNQAGPDACERIYRNLKIAGAVLRNEILC